VLKLSAVALLAIVLLVTPVGADILRGGISRLGAVTDPGTLMLLGAALVVLGVWSRRTFTRGRAG
jgi:hypothetical protein